MIRDVIEFSNHTYTEVQKRGTQASKKRFSIISEHHLCIYLSIYPSSQFYSGYLLNSKSKDTSEPASQPAIHPSFTHSFTVNFILIFEMYLELEIFHLQFRTYLKTSFPRKTNSFHRRIIHKPTTPLSSSFINQCTR